jgi:hypothetical protein
MSLFAVVTPIIPCLDMCPFEDPDRIGHVEAALGERPRPLVGIERDLHFL